MFRTVDVRRTVIGKTNGNTWEINPTAVIVVERKGGVVGVMIWFKALAYREMADRKASTPRRHW